MEIPKKIAFFGGIREFFHLRIDVSDRSVFFDVWEVISEGSLCVKPTHVTRNFPK